MPYFECDFEMVRQADKSCLVIQRDLAAFSKAAEYGRMILSKLRKTLIPCNSFSSSDNNSRRNANEAFTRHEMSAPMTGRTKVSGSFPSSSHNATQDSTTPGLAAKAGSLPVEKFNTELLFDDFLTKNQP